MLERKKQSKENNYMVNTENAHELKKVTRASCSVKIILQIAVFKTSKLNEWHPDKGCLPAHKIAKLK